MRIKGSLKKSVVLGILVSVSLCLAGCAQKTRPDIENANLEIKWPHPPATPRIHYLTSLKTPADIRPDDGIWRKLFYFIRGVKQPRLRHPHGLAKDVMGRLYIVDTHYSSIHVFDEAAGDYYQFPKESLTGLVNPIDVTIGSEGKIFVSDSVSGTIHVFIDAGKSYLGSFGKGQLKRPTGLVVRNDTNELFVVDTIASQVLVYDQNTQTLKKRIGQQARSAAGFHYPTSIARSRSGDMYVTDTLNYRIQHLTKALEFSDSFGQAGDGPGDFSRPKGVATDSDGNVYVVDALFDNVQIFDRNGKLLMVFGSPGSREGEFWLPSAIFIDQQDRIYVSDTYNKRVQVFQYLKMEGVTP